jgi:hypothetical protein
VQRLVIALTTFLAMMAGVVVVGYLLIFAASPDRASRAIPADATVYATLYLQPSTGQKMNLAALLGHVPGLADPTSLDQKLHEIAARLLGEAGLDYEADLRPWLGNQLAMAVELDGTDPSAAHVIALVAVKDPALAGEALDRIAADHQLSGETESYKGVEVITYPDGAWALLDDLLVLGNDAAGVKAALDADANRAPSLADDQGFLAAMRRVPADHLASMYVNLRGLPGATAAQMGGYTDASLALVVEQNGLRITGNAPFDADSAPAGAREAFALASEPSSLADWMPDDTQAELVVFGISQTLRAAEEQLGADPATADAADAIDQLRAVAAIGLGINLDDDLLPLFDREAAVAVGGLQGGSSMLAGQLLLRPSDADAAAAALDRMRDALQAHGATVDESQADGVTITTVDVPDFGAISYAMRDGVIVAGLDADSVGAALSAASDGSTLGASARYRSAWELAGAHGGNEFWVDVASAMDAAGADLGVTGDVRDILLSIDALAMTAPARDEISEFHLVLTAR